MFSKSLKTPAAGYNFSQPERFYPRQDDHNALIAFECLHAISSNSDDRSSFCAYKLDLSKAYDRVDWGFLNKVLLKLGFQSEWVQRVMSCVTFVRYSIRFNGVQSASFSPSRGLRQGDPLSRTYFCLLLMVYLS